MWQVKWLQCQWTEPWFFVDKKTESISIINVRSMYDLVTVQIGWYSAAVIGIGNFGIKCRPPPQFLVIACTTTGVKPTRFFSKILWTIIAALEYPRTGEGEGQTSNKNKWPRRMFDSKLPIPMTEDWCFICRESHPASILHNWSSKMFLSSFWKRFKSEKLGNGLDLNKFNIMNNHCEIR